MKKILSVIIIILLLITGFAVYFLNALGDKVIDQMIDSELASFEVEDVPEDIGDVQEGNIQDGKDVVKPPAGSEEEQQDEEEIQKQGQVNPSSADNNNPGKGGKEKSKISVKEINDIKEQVTFSDKMTAASLLVKKLTPDDIDELKELAAGGLSNEEKEAAKKIAYDRFNAEEIKQIKEIYHKYMK